MLRTLSLWAHLDSNQGPTGYEPAALPLSYGPRASLQGLCPLDCTIARARRQSQRALVFAVDCGRMRVMDRPPRTRQGGRNEGGAAAQRVTIPEEARRISKPDGS